MVCKYFHKKTAIGSVTRAQSEILQSKTLATQDEYAIENKELAQKLHKPIIKIIEKRKVFSIFTVNMHGLFLLKIKKVLQLLMLFKKFFSKS